MKCQICNHEIPQGKRFCPGCGRVVKSTELKAEINIASTDVTSDTIIYKPATISANTNLQKTMHIPDIFNSDPNTPEYTSPHAYDRATADILQYDRMFVNTDSSDVYTDKKSASANTYTQQDEYAENEPGYTIEQEYDEQENHEREQFYYDSKPRLNVNPKIIFICIAVIAGIAVIGTGIFKIGRQFGLWGSDEPNSSIVQENDTHGEMAPVVDEPGSQADKQEYIIGIYTVSTEQNNIFLFKSDTEEKIIATIPTYTVIEITEIKDGKGKTTHGTYTGWVNMSELEYTPDANLNETEKETETETETTEETTKDETTQEETTTKAETTTAQTETTTQTNPENNNVSLPATYTVNLSSDGNYVNVRAESSIDSAIVSTLNDGVTVTVDKIVDDWGHVKAADGTEGWVFMVYLK